MSPSELIGSLAQPFAYPLTHPLTHPEWTAATAGVLVAAALALALARWRARARRRALLGPWGQAPSGQLLRDLALLAALAALGLALLGPRIGERLIPVSASGIDAVFVVDVSRSMDARDVPPSRLARARRAIEELVGRLRPGDRVALAAFGGRGVLLTPLTPDHRALLEVAGALDTDLIPPARSELHLGLRAGIEAFEAASERPRVVFLLSDGETASTRADLAAAAEAARAEVRVLAAALGSDLGAEVPDHGRPLRDVGGRVVVSRRRSQRLAELVDATGGELFVADEWGSFDFEAAAAALRRDAAGTPGTPGELALRRVPAARVLPFALLAFALLLLESLPAPRRPAVRVARRRLASFGLALLLPLCLAAQPGADARDAVLEVEEALRGNPRDARLLVELGLARLESGQPPGAARAFRAAAAYAREPALAALAYYDLGVAALEDGDLVRARDAFFDALALEPGDGRARFNLEWTLRALEARPPEATAPPPPPGATADPPQAERRRGALEEESTPTPAEPRAALPLSDAQRRRILERLEDDPTRALRGAPGQAPPRRTRPLGPAW